MEEKLSLIILDREKIEKNLFWQVLVKAINTRLVAAENDCKHSISASLDKIRFYQGQVSAWELFFDLPDLVLDDLKNQELEEERRDNL